MKSKVLIGILVVFGVSFIVKPAPNVRALEYSTRLTMTLKDGKIENYDSSGFNIYYIDDKTVYQIPYTDISFVNDSLSKREKRYWYFLFKTGVDSGYFIKKDFEVESIDRLPLDSMLRVYNTLNPKLAKFAALAPDTTYKVGSGLTKVFTDPESLKLSTKNTWFFHYSKNLVGVKQTLNPQMDNIPAMKLTKLKAEIDVSKVPEYQNKVSLLTMHYELTEKKPDHLDLILGYCKKVFK